EDPGQPVRIGQRRTNHIRIGPATADPIPTARRILSGVASALFIALRIQPGLAANNSPSSTNRIPTPMRKSANAMDLIGLNPPRISGAPPARRNRTASSSRFFHSGERGRTQNEVGSRLAGLTVWARHSPRVV